MSPSSRNIEAGERRWRAGTLVYTAGGLGVVFFWLLWGDFAFQLKERSVQPTLTRLLQQFHASDMVAGTLIGSLPQLISVLFGPVIGYLSDRHRGKWGRRIPFLLGFTPLTVAAMVGLAYSPQIGRWVSGGGAGADRWVIACFALFWTIFEFGSVTCNSLLIALVNDVVPPGLIGRFFGLFRIFSVAAGIGFMYFLMGKAAEHYVGIFLGIGAVYGVSFTAMCLKVQEPGYPPPEVNTGGPWGATKMYMRECFAKPYYLWYFASVAVAQLAFQPINIFSLYFAGSVGVSDDRYGKLSAMQFALSLTLSYPLGWLVDKFHPLRLVMASLIFHGVSTLAAFFLVRGPAGFGVAHVICGAMAGCWLTTWYALTPALVPRAKFAQYFSAMTICYAAAQFVGGIAFGHLFDVIHHQYRYMYLLGCLFDFFAVGLTLVVYRYFKRYGGRTGYVAPE
ncbi:MAG TPA: MFS transporter [Tepidisphaeraceae bacterium]|nr:MFS transporter [Tepidisphaeraceae bacterium]